MRKLNYRLNKLLNELQIFDYISRITKKKGPTNVAEKASSSKAQSKKRQAFNSGGTYSGQANKAKRNCSKKDVIKPKGKDSKKTKKLNEQKQGNNGNEKCFYGNEKCFYGNGEGHWK